jgi:hypothetical protein
MKENRKKKCRKIIITKAFAAREIFIHFSHFKIINQSIFMITHDKISKKREAKFFTCNFFVHSMKTE